MVQKFEPIKLTDHLYQIGTPYFPGYLSLGETNMLIDGGTSATADIVAAQLEMLDIDPQRIEYIAITHSHADHIGALSRLKKKWPHLKTIASARAAKAMGNPKLIQQFEGMDHKIAKNMKSASEIEDMPAAMPAEEYNFTVDIIADENTRIDLGNDICWTVTPTPGHAGCQICLFEESEKSALIGDAIGFYNQEVKAFWPNYFESLPDYVDSIKKIAALKPARIGLGHNGSILEDVQSFLAAALDTTRTYHEEMVARVAGGEDIKAIADDKAQKMDFWAGHMAFVIPFACQGLIKQSLKTEKDQAVPDFSLA